MVRDQPTAEAWTDVDDRAVLVRIGRGDRDALGELYSVHAGWLTARLQRRCADTELVDTALQDTFVAVWRSAATFRGEGDAAAWLWGIAVRRLIDLLRRRRPAVPMAELPDGPSARSAESDLFSAGGHGDLADALAELDPDLRSALLATAVDGLTTREAADLLGVPQGTIKTRLMRARARMQGSLAHRSDEEDR